MGQLLLVIGLSALWVSRCCVVLLNLLDQDGIPVASMSEFYRNFVLL